MINMGTETAKKTSTKNTSNALPKDVTDLIDTFASQELELNAKGNPKWNKATIKKLSGVTLVKNADGMLLNFNDGSQRFGYNTKTWNAYSNMKRQMLANFVNNVDYMDKIARYVFESEGTSSEKVSSI